MGPAPVQPFEQPFGFEPSFDGRWWEAKEPCPRDSKLFGGAPPDAHIVWCQRRGDKHGPYTDWYTNGRKAFEGAFVDGEKHGFWLRWWETGQVAHVGGWLEMGELRGRWTFYNDDGTMARIAQWDPELEEFVTIVWGVYREEPWQRRARERDMLADAGREPQPADAGP